MNNKEKLYLAKAATGLTPSPIAAPANGTASPAIGSRAWRIKKSPEFNHGQNITPTPNRLAKPTTP